MSDHKLEMEDIDDDDDIMDEAVEFDIPQNAEVNDDQVPEMKDFLKKIVGTIAYKRASCWKHFNIITPDGHPKPRAACKWCRKDYACHSNLNVLLQQEHESRRCSLGLLFSLAVELGGN